MVRIRIPILATGGVVTREYVLFIVSIDFIIKFIIKIMIKSKKRKKVYKCEQNNGIKVGLNVASDHVQHSTDFIFIFVWF
jgi:hypothetical protein